MYVAGPAVREICSTLDVKEDEENDAIKQKLKDHFAPLKNIDYHLFEYQKYLFSQIEQMEGEPLDKFIVRLRVAAMRCEFKEGLILKSNAKLSFAATH